MVAFGIGAPRAGRPRAAPEKEFGDSCLASQPERLREASQKFHPSRNPFGRPRNDAEDGPDFRKPQATNKSQDFWETLEFSGNSRMFGKFRDFREIPGFSGNSRTFGKFRAALETEFSGNSRIYGELQDFQNFRGINFREAPEFYRDPGPARPGSNSAPGLPPR